MIESALYFADNWAPRWRGTYCAADTYAYDYPILGQQCVPCQDDPVPTATTATPPALWWTLAPYPCNPNFARVSVLLLRHRADLHSARRRRRRPHQLVRLERVNFNMPSWPRAGPGPGHQNPVLLRDPLRPGLHRRPGLLPVVPAGPLQAHGRPGPLHRLPPRNLCCVFRVQQLRRLPRLPHRIRLDRRELQLRLRHWLRPFHTKRLSSLQYRDIQTKHSFNQLRPVQQRILRVRHGFHILFLVPARHFTEFYLRLHLRRMFPGLLPEPIRRLTLRRLFHGDLLYCQRLLRRLPARLLPAPPCGLRLRRSLTFRLRVKIKSVY